MSSITVGSIPFECVLKVFDLTTHAVVLSTADAEHIHADVASLPVVRVYAVDNTVYVDVRT